MRDPLKIGAGGYFAKNARILRIDINGAGIFVHMVARSTSGHFTLQLPALAGVIADLCRIIETDSLTDIGEGPCVRALTLTTWADGVNGIANFMEDFGLSTFDYYEGGDPERGLLEKTEDDMPPHGEEKLFYMSTLDPPPGLPWTMHRPPLGSVAASWFELHDADGKIIGHVEGPLGDWLTKKAQLATFEE